ncbi:MAG TPA: TolC family protein [Puia sp.]|jgi:outer membrane protein TolC|nr:TolC family protein [Puia sp.]
MKKIICLIGMLGVVAARGQTIMSLDSIFSVISRNNPALRSSDASARSLDEAAKGARSWEAPMASTGWWMTPYDPSLWKRQANGASGMGQYMVSAEQLFPNRRSQEAQQKYLGALSSVERTKKGATMNELYASARQAYFQWLVAKRREMVLDDNGKLLDFMIRDAELKYKNNLGKIGAYYKAKAALGNLENRRIALDNIMEQQRIKLNTLMNRDKVAAFDIDTSYKVMDVAGLGADSAGLLDSRSDIRAVSESIRVTGLEQDAERARLKPEFGVRYDHMFGFGGTPMQYSLMATVRLPMAAWASRGVKANVESLKWKALSLEEERDAMVTEATGAAYGLKRAILAKQRQVHVLAEQVLPALRKNFETMELAYEQNTEELFTLYDAWETLDSSQMEYWDIVESLLMMQVELKRVLEIK